LKTKIFSFFAKRSSQLTLALYITVNSEVTVKVCAKRTYFYIKGFKIVETLMFHKSIETVTVRFGADRLLQWLEGPRADVRAQRLALYEILGNRFRQNLIFKT
jgi:hypothetical protein